MNNYQLSDLLREYPVTVCSADRVGKKKNHFYVTNTAVSGEKGEHWVVFYFKEDGPDEFFDSLGRSPDAHGFSPSRPYLMNRDQIQDAFSDVCGLYCAYYVMYRYHRATLEDIVEPFDISDTRFNDLLVRHIVNNNEA